MNQFQQNLLEAIEIVSAWELPEEDFATAVNAQARLMCGVPSDEPWRPDPDSTIQ